MYLVRVIVGAISISMIAALPLNVVERDVGNVEEIAK